MRKRINGLYGRLRGRGTPLHQSWRTAVLVALPAPAVALLLGLLLERPSGQVTPFDTVAYPLLAGLLLLLEGMLLLNKRSFEQTVLVVIALASLFFFSKFVYILYFLPESANFFKELSETFPWVPAIYILSSLLPMVRGGRRVALWCLSGMVGLSLVFIGTHLGLGPAYYGQIYALSQLMLANVTFYVLSHFFALYMKRYTRSQAHVETMERLAYTDILTDLPNRFALERTLADTNLTDRRSIFALLFIDIDGFKLINDTMGHEAGDTLLVQIAERLQGAVRQTDLLTRSSGDEFVVLLRDLKTSTEGIWVAEKLKLSLGEPFFVDGQVVNIGASIGVSVYPEDASEPGELLRHADSAMYYVKHFGKNGVKRYHASDDAAREDDKQLERDLRQALARNELGLFYQPLFDLRTGRLVKTEVLLRWRHPERGWIAPSDFIPLAEASGYIVTLGAWVLKTAAEQARTWQLSSLYPVRICVNVSALQFAQPLFSDMVLSALKAARLEPHFLELELTESIVMRNPEVVRRNLQILQEHGITVAIDDFGTGYSSLSYLRDFNIDTVKVDRSFIRELSTPRRAPQYALALVEAIVRLASSLDVELVAEGIETKEQLELVRELGCNVGQGYYFSRPMESGEFSMLLKKNVPLDLSNTRISKNLN